MTQIILPVDRNPWALISTSFSLPLIENFGLLESLASNESALRFSQFSLVRSGADGSLGTETAPSVEETSCEGLRLGER